MDVIKVSFSYCGCVNPSGREKKCGFVKRKESTTQASLPPFIFLRWLESSLVLECNIGLKVKTKKAV